MLAVFKLGTTYDRGTLIPWFDMMNHGTMEEFNMEYKYSVDRGMVVTAAEDVKEGQELLISYHDRSDDDLLMVG